MGKPYILYELMQLSNTFWFSHTFCMMGKWENVIKMNKTQKKIRDTIKEIEELLIRKNDQYGDSVMEPIGIFAKGNSQDLIRVRIDDKLSRLVRGNDSIESDEDIVQDLIGYLILLLINMRDSE
jgi:hypothetical protein